jgi:hypothetical protein
MTPPVVAPDRPNQTATAPAQPLYFPAEWTPVPSRDVALDLLRGLAMVILVVNHMRLPSLLDSATGALLSAAEVLVPVSGVVVGMVFGRRWVERGARATTLMLLRRARKLYVASIAVVALVGLVRLAPGVTTDPLTVLRSRGGLDLYAFDGPLETLLAVLTLKAGPWQFNILGFFVVSLALAPLLLHALARGRWRRLLAGSLALYAIGRGWQADVLPAQSERPFPILVWQVLFVPGMIVGWHRAQIAAALRPHARLATRAVVGLALAAATLRLAGPLVPGWSAWEAAHFDKSTLDLLRILAMASLAGAFYVGVRRHARLAERVLAPVLLPLGRNSFYVFVVHVFLVLVLVNIPAVSDGDGLGLVGNSVLQVCLVGLLVLMVRRRFLFRWIPR